MGRETGREAFGGGTSDYFGFRVILLVIVIVIVILLSVVHPIIRVGLD